MAEEGGILDTLSKFASTVGDWFKSKIGGGGAGGESAPADPNKPKKPWYAALGFAKENGDVDMGKVGLAAVIGIAIATLTGGLGEGVVGLLMAMFVGAAIVGIGSKVFGGSDSPKPGAGGTAGPAVDKPQRTPQQFFEAGLKPEKLQEVRAAAKKHVEQTKEESLIAVDYLMSKGGMDTKTAIAVAANFYADTDPAKASYWTEDRKKAFKTQFGHEVTTNSPEVRQQQLDFVIAEYNGPGGANARKQVEAAKDGANAAISVGGQFFFKAAPGEEYARRAAIAEELEKAHVTRLAGTMDRTGVSGGTDVPFPGAAPLQTVAPALPEPGRQPVPISI